MVYCLQPFSKAGLRFLKSNLPKFYFTKMTIQLLAVHRAKFCSPPLGENPSGLCGWLCLEERWQSLAEPYLQPVWKLCSNLSCSQTWMLSPWLAPFSFAICTSRCDGTFVRGEMFIPCSSVRAWKLLSLVTPTRGDPILLPTCSAQQNILGMILSQRELLTAVPSDSENLNSKMWVWAVGGCHVTGTWFPKCWAYSQNHRIYRIKHGPVSLSP